MSAADLELCTKFFATVGARDMAAVMTMISPDYVASEPPELPYGGERHGPQGFVDLLTDLNRDYELTVKNWALHDSGTFVTAVIDAEFTSRASGRSARAAIVELYTFADGLLIRTDIYYKDPGAVATLMADGAG